MGKEPDHTYSNEELMNGLMRGDFGIVRYVEEQSIPYVMRSMGKEGSRQRAEEIVQDACLVLYRKLNEDRLQLNCRFLTYFIAVCKNILICSNRLKGEKTFWYGVNEETATINDEEIGRLWMESREFRLYRRHFNTLKEKQRKIFESSLDGVPYKDLYSQFGFKSEDAYKNEVFRIKKRLVKKITDDPEFLQLKNRIYWSYNE